MVVNQLHYFFSDESFSAMSNVDISEKMKLLKQNGMLLMSVVCSGKAILIGALTVAITVLKDGNTDDL